MCLLYSKEKTEKTLKNIKKGKKVFWKIFELEKSFEKPKGYLVSFYQRNIVCINKRTKILRSNRHNKKFNKEDCDYAYLNASFPTYRYLYYTKGIHVYNTREKAREVLKKSKLSPIYSNRKAVLARVEVDVRDFVASGDKDDSLFMKVKVVSY